MALALRLGTLLCMAVPLRGMNVGNHRAAWKSQIDAGQSRVHRRVQPDNWENFAVLDFRYAEMGHNNLGGQGPDKISELMDFKNVTTYRGKSLDLVVRAKSDYSGNVSKNGISGSFGQINVAPNTPVTLQFSFRDPETLESVVVPAFTFSYWDMDRDKYGGIETMTIGPIVAYYVTPDTEIVVTEMSPSYWNFTASTFGRFKDNPKDLDSLTEEQMNRGVEVALAMESTFECTFYASPNTHGRTFLFGGNSKLLEEPPHPVGDCDDLTRLDFSNYLGGSLPQPGLRWGAVTEKDGKPVDLLITADDGYVAANASKNGMNGEVININVKANVTTTLAFKFVDSNDQPVELSRFYFTLLDVDGPKYGTETAVIQKKFNKYFLGVDSLVKVEDRGNEKMFQSTTFGRQGDNADKRYPLSEFQQSVAFSLFYSEPVSEVTMQYSLENALIGRQLQVTGVTEIPCPELFQ